MAGSFQPILDRAAANKGGMAALEALLPVALPPDELRALPDSRWLAQMTRRVFQAGFAWSVVDAKWDGFEAAFEGFEPRRVAMYGDEELDRLLSDPALVRNGAKLRAAVANARFLADLADENGTAAAAVFADWPDDDYVGLLDLLKRRGNRLGGNTGQYVCRFMGKPAFILSRDTVAALVREGVVDRPPTSRRAMASVQAAFDAWRAETGRDLSQLGRILAASV